MYNGSNPTALKSQEMFMDALLNLMEERPFSEISVTAICRKADLSRQTFYLLFETKENILDLKFNRIFERYVGIIVHEPQLSTRKVADWFANFLDSEYAFVRMLVENHLTSIMVQHFRKYLLEVDQMIVSRERPMQNYAMAFLAGALAETAAEYVRDAAAPDLKQLSQAIQLILTGSYFTM